MATASKSRSNQGLNRRSVALHAVLPAREAAEPKTQLGVRISTSTHRQLKLAATLRGEPVQTLAEQAIQEFLTNHPELLQTSPSELRSKAPPRRPR
jgi:hypothetical protein